MDPTYQLSEIRDLIQKCLWAITSTAQSTAFEIGFDDIDIIECIRDELRESHFYKTMPSEKVPGLWQDVYRIRFRGQNIYLKLQITRKKAVIISFKEA
jgi:hypothetical protein